MKSRKKNPAYLFMERSRKKENLEAKPRHRCTYVVFRDPLARVARGYNVKVFVNLTEFM